ncbi:MAG TPA: hypothetical protein VMX76_02525 [Nevskiaceae bacterium]|nr:hypothetical protein [Nevskiaceae bacterium]
MSNLLTIKAIEFNKANQDEIKKEINNFSKSGKIVTKLWKIFLVISVSLRLTIPFFIFKYPLWSFLTFTFFDWADYNPYKKAGFSEKKYNAIDKLLDFYSYIFMTFYFFTTPIFFALLGLLIFRLAGTVIFYLKNNHLFLFLFPNLIEPAFLSLLLAKLYLFNAINLFIFFFILKMIQEYIVHILLIRNPTMRILKIKIGKLKSKIIINSSPLDDYYL